MFLRRLKEARLLYSKFWNDNFICQLHVAEKLVFTYLLTNQFVNIIDFYECSDRQIMFDTGVSQKILENFKDKVSKSGKILFYKTFVFIRNAHKYQTFRGEKNDIKKDKILSLLPNDVLSWYNNVLDTPIDTPIDRVLIPSNNQYPIINNQYTIINKREFSKINDLTPEVLKEIYETYNFPTGFIEDKLDDLKNYCESKGKSYKNYKAALISWCKKEAKEIRKEGKNGKPRAIDAEQIIRERRMVSESKQRSLHT